MSSLIAKRAASTMMTGEALIGDRSPFSSIISVGLKTFSNNSSGTGSAASIAFLKSVPTVLTAAFSIFLISVCLIPFSSN